VSRAWFALILIVAASAQAGAKTTSIALQRQAPRVAANPWVPDFSLALSSVTDMNDKNRERMYSNSLGVGADWSLNKNFSASTVVGVGYSAVNTEIEKNSRSSMTDTYAGLGYKYKLSDIHSLALQVGAFLPTSESTQYEGQRGRYLGLASIRSKVTSWYSISNKISGQYIAHTYNYSPTTDELNRKTLADYSLDNIFSKGNFFASTGFGVRITTFMDGLSELSYFNISKIGVKAGPFSGYLSYMNGSYRDDQRLQPLFFDRYKQMVEFVLVYAF